MAALSEAPRVAPPLFIDVRTSPTSAARVSVLHIRQYYATAHGSALHVTAEEPPVWSIERPEDIDRKIVAALIYFAGILE